MGDHNTTGLQGNEQRSDDPEEQNNFCALVKDELYSDKSDPHSGGSFGLGKALLWAYSSFKTVFFVSSLKKLPGTCENPRAIARCSLPWHQTEEDGPCDGNGWFGTPQMRSSHHGQLHFAGSLWGNEATALASSIYCHRDTKDYGLSALILGFSEPGGEDRDSQEVAQNIVSKTTESFWPALAAGRLRVNVAVQHNENVVLALPVEIDETSTYYPLVHMLNEYRTGHVIREAPGSPEDVVAVGVPLTLPKRLKDGNEHPEFSGSVTLLLRLLDENLAPTEIRDRVFAFRGPGMVVRANHRSNLSITARPYTAVLVCGSARSDSEDDDRIDLFLKASEPPAHDLWTHNTRAIKQNYKVHGCKAKLDNFDKAVRDAVRQLVSVQEEAGGGTPEQMRRHLRFGQKGGGGTPSVCFCKER